jgi:hypothetical protein
MFTRRKLAGSLAAVVGLALAPVATASAATIPAVSAAPSPGPAVITFIPPKVSPIQVMIGATFFRGKLISPGVDVSTKGVSLPPIIVTLPS